MFFEVLTLFPAMFQGAFDDSIIHRAVEKGLVKITLTNIRDFALDRHKTVDDYPYGGDAGMLMKCGPVVDAIKAAQERLAQSQPKVVYLSPHGQKLDHALVEELLKENALILLCGRYKGIDERVRKKYVDKEISIGDYVLSGGEIPAMVLVDAITRLIPGVLGNRESAENDSFYNGLLSPPQYTRPEIFEGEKVPEVLVGGHHRLIKEWQIEQARKMTQEQRPDLWERNKKNDNVK